MCVSNEIDFTFTAKTFKNRVHPRIVQRVSRTDETTRRIRRTSAHTRTDHYATAAVDVGPSALNSDRSFFEKHNDCVITPYAYHACFFFLSTKSTSTRRSRRAVRSSRCRCARAVASGRVVRTRVARDYRSSAEVVVCARRRRYARRRVFLAAAAAAVAFRIEI